MKCVMRTEAMAGRSWIVASIVLIVGLAAVGILPGVAGAQQQLVGTTSVVKAGAGDQVNPRVDCNLASYTDDQGFSSDVRYFDFNTGADSVIPTFGLKFLSAIDGSRIAFTSVSAAGNQIVVFDTATLTSFTIPGGSARSRPSIRGSLVAFEDRSFSANPNESEIVAYDLSSGVTTRLTNDALMDTNPQVSPTGNAVVFQKCQTTGFGCDIYVAVQIAPGVFTTTPLTGAEGDERNPHTNGTVVVYESTQGVERHIFFKPITGGTATQIAIAGDQRNPTFSGSLIAFESQVGTQYEVFVYDIASNTVFRATNTAVDETLNDISVCNGVARIVYSAPGASGDFDVFAFTFTPPGATVPFGSLIAAVAFDRGPRANDDQLRVGGVFAPGNGSNGINPLTEPVALQVGGFAITVPAGALHRDRFGLLRFEGTIDGHHVKMVLTPQARGRYAFAAEADGLDLPGTRTPVAVALRIGDDAGTVTVTPFLD